jgi:glucose/arabinose dehydrogenase
LQQPGSRLKIAGIAALLACALAAAGVVVFNVGGWRELVVSRIFSVSNPPAVAAAPVGFRPRAPQGFTVSVFASGFRQPRWLAVAPNGDVFVADSSRGEIVVLHQRPGGTSSDARDLFVNGLSLPFGIAFRDRYVYVAATDRVVRYVYDRRTSRRMSDAEHLFDLPGGGYNQHWTRSLAFDRGGRLFVSIGSKSNVGVEPDPRAAVVSADADGRNVRVYARGLRNAVGIAVHPATGVLWATVNERDNLGDEEPRDFFTRVVDGGFYGWPYAYGAGRIDRRVRSRLDLTARMIPADLPLGAHVAPLQFAFYTGDRFPAMYRGGAFIAQHGSWNRRVRSGYDVVFVPFSDGMPSGEPRTFLDGFVPNPAATLVYGRPVGVAVHPDGTLLVSDDGAGVIWRVAFEG